MKLLFNTLVLFSLFYQATAQTTVIRGKIPSMKGAEISIGRPTKYLIFDTQKIGFIEGEIAQNGEFSLNLGAIDKEIVFISIWNKQNDSRLFFQYLYITKGDNLFFFGRF